MWGIVFCAFFCMLNRWNQLLFRTNSHVSLNILKNFKLILNLENIFKIIFKTVVITFKKEGVVRTLLDKFEKYITVKRTNKFCSGTSPDKVIKQSTNHGVKVMSGINRRELYRQNYYTLYYGKTSIFWHLHSLKDIDRFQLFTSDIWCKG